MKGKRLLASRTVMAYARQRQGEMARRAQILGLRPLPRDPGPLRGNLRSPRRGAAAWREVSAEELVAAQALLGCVHLDVSRCQPVVLDHCLGVPVADRPVAVNAERRQRRLSAILPALASC